MILLIVNFATILQTVSLLQSDLITIIGVLWYTYLGLLCTFFHFSVSSAFDHV